MFEVGFYRIGILASLYLSASVFSTSTVLSDRTGFAIWGSIFFEQVTVPFSGFFMPCSGCGECLSCRAGIGIGVGMVGEFGDQIVFGGSVFV